LNKSEALAVLHEIYGACRESVIITCISIDSLSSKVFKDPENGGFTIRMQCNLDDYSRKCIKPVLENHMLAMIEEKGYVTIFKLHN